MSLPRSSLVAATVMHQRLGPTRHRLRYRALFMLLDLDELDALDARLKCFGLNRKGVFAFHEADHGASASVRLRQHIDAQLMAAGIAGGGRVRLLTMPRILGHAFNPLSIFLCEHPGGGMAAVIYEVTSTFGERHRYLVEVEADQQHATTLQHACGKRLHVSPFMDMDLHYRFTVQLPTEERPDLVVQIDACDAQGVVLKASMSAQCTELSDAKLVASFVRSPLLGLKVLAAIHWEALRLLLKGAPFRRHPGPAVQPTTVIRSKETPSQ